MAEEVVLIAERDGAGKFLPGVTGNKRGRPPSRRDKIQRIQERLELAIRRHLVPEDISDVVKEMVRLAKGGDTKAAKLIMEYTIGKPGSPEAAPASESQSIVIRIENATFKAQHPEPAAIEGKYETV